MGSFGFEAYADVTRGGERLWNSDFVLWSSVSCFGVCATMSVNDLDGSRINGMSGMSAGPDVLDTVAACSDLGAEALTGWYCRFTACNWSADGRAEFAEAGIHT